MTAIKLTPEKEAYIKEQAAIALTKRDWTATDTGTCVLGAGICIYVILKGKRNPSRMNIIRAPFQGNVGSYQALKPCLEYLQTNCPELGAYWEDGNMD
jgi:hypothetical protein